MIIVKNLKSVSDQEWSTTKKYPGVRWKFLIDADYMGSSGLSLGFAEIAPGGDLVLHYHSPAEIYVVTDGTGILNKSGKLEEIKNWEIKDPDFRQQLTKDENRFVAEWLSKNDLSDEAKEVIEKAKVVYQLFYSNLNQMSTIKWKIDSWDAGWYQIRRCLTEHNFGTEELNELSKASEQLANKILPQIEEFGFLDTDEVYDEV